MGGGVREGEKKVEQHGHGTEGRAGERALVKPPMTIIVNPYHARVNGEGGQGEQRIAPEWDAHHQQEQESEGTRENKGLESTAWQERERKIERQTDREP